MSESQRFSPFLGAVLGLVAGLALAFGLLLGPFGLQEQFFDSGAAESGDVADDGQLWTCGMHPNVIEDEPGTCPICQMDLVPLETGADAAPAEHGEHEHGESGAPVYVCPMHPDIIESEPGTCPICGMDLVLEETEPTAMSENGAGPTVRIDPAVVQNMNVRTAPVERRDLHREIRTVGYLDYDQERMVTVTTKFSGWVEKVHVNYVGQPVAKGQPLFEIYSPELVQTQREMLSALEFVRKLSAAPADARQRAEELVEATRERLGYWDVTPEQIQRLEESGEVVRTLTVAAPAGGMVMKRMVGLEGMAVKPGMETYHIANLDRLWLTVEIFENQLVWVEEGSPAEVTLPYFPGRAYQGRIRYLEPEFSEKTRTLQVKIEVPNPRRELRKGMYATVRFAPLAVADAVAVPSEAVLRTGERDVVVVDDGDGRFTPRNVVLGYEAEGYTQILDGVEPGETVVTSAQFLLDSESKLRQAIAKVVSERGQAKQENGADMDAASEMPMGHQH